MELSFDYYRNLERTDFYLCNPDGKELFPLQAENRNFVLRFNDLSELTFDVYSKCYSPSGDEIKVEAYDYLETKRLIYATNIGWFQISVVNEKKDGITTYKSVTAESHQAIFKQKGFTSEERVYCLYNNDDPLDEFYDSTDEAAIPSVVGQLSRQLGIKILLRGKDYKPAKALQDWTITYVSNSLRYSKNTAESSICRSFKENTTFGYEWMTNEVEDAFGVIFDFDFLYRTIRIMHPSEVTERANVLFTFNNFMKSIDVQENSENIVTVLNCSGDNCDITSVNPTGTNYICDFSYYMDETNKRWMSDELISKLKEWNSACVEKKDEYEDLIEVLRGQEYEKLKSETSLEQISLILQDLKVAQTKRDGARQKKSGSELDGKLCGIVSAETVKTGEKSIYNGMPNVSGSVSSDFSNIEFTGSSRILAYDTQPDYDPGTQSWYIKEGSLSKSATADTLIKGSYDENDIDNYYGSAYVYFFDTSDKKSYCKLKTGIKVDKDTKERSYFCDGYDRYIAYTYPTHNYSTGTITYTDYLQFWIKKRETQVNELNGDIRYYNEDIEIINSDLKRITTTLNLLNFLSDSPSLLRELNCYWIEGDYTNENIAVLETTTPEEEIGLANELMESGYIELSKISQPRYTFTLEAVDVLRQYEFRKQMQELKLGRIIATEKEEGVIYYPALLEMSFNLDQKDTFSLVFANALRLDDWGYTYADLITEASSTSRKVNSSWQDLLRYAKERETITSLIKDPLDATLRASFANAINQEFTVDKNGILGRKRVSADSDDFEDEQVRLINNVLLFTDDNWKTAKTALGKIYYTDENGNAATSYGLIAETIIGSLIMGNTLKIINSNNSVQIDGAGITIKNKYDQIVFKASTDGTMKVSSYVDSDTYNGQYKTLKDTISTLTVNTNNISAEVKSKVNETGYGESFGWSLKSNGFYLTSNGETVMSVDKEGLKVGSSQSGVRLYTNYPNDSNYSLSIGGSSLRNNWRIICGDKFGVDRNGNLFAGGSEGSIAGWKMSNYNDYSLLYSAAGGLGVGMSTSISGGDPAFWAGLNYWGENPWQKPAGSTDSWNQHCTFYVTHDGFLHAENADITGTITATSGRIGAWSISTGIEEYIPNNSIFGFYHKGQQDQHIAVLHPNYGLGYSPELGDAVYFVSFEQIHWSCRSFASYVENSESDGNTKCQVEYFDEKYNLLFDNLQPRRYKYIKGTSGRFHTGYIAQEVVNAVESSGLTLDDFAAVVKLDKPTERGSEWLLRRDEFVALNTWQIQKLKDRVNELEAIVREMASNLS